MKTISTFIALLFSMMIFAQSNNQFAVFGGVNYQPVLKGNTIAGDLTGRYYVGEKLSLGLGFDYTFKKYNQGFDYPTDKTLMHNVTLNSVVQYDFLNSEKLTVGVFLANGASIVTLRDRNDTKTTETTQEIDGIWQTTIVEVPKRLGRDAFYILTPGIDFSCKVVTLDQEFNTHLYITSRIGYQMAFGDGDFAKPKKLHRFCFDVRCYHKRRFVRFRQKYFTLKIYENPL